MKWVSRKWFPFIVQIFSLSIPGSYVLKKMFVFCLCNWRIRYINHEKIENVECLRNISIIGTVAGLLIIPLLIYVAFYLNFDPVDSELIINEQAAYLTSRYNNKFMSIISTTKFKEEFFKF